MSDPELEAIRAKRLAELQASQGAAQRMGHGAAGSQAQQLAERREKEEDMRNSILSQILSQEARARLSTIALAKPERAQMLENILISNAQRGAIQGKLSEEQLKGFLEQVNEQISKKTTTVKYDRRRLDDSDSDDLDDL